MKKHTSKLIALVLALCLCLSLSRYGVRGGDRQLRRLRLHPRQPQPPPRTAPRAATPPPTACASPFPPRSRMGHVAGRRRDHRQQLPDRQPLLRRGAREVRFHHRSSGWKLTAFGNKSISPRKGGQQ